MASTRHPPEVVEAGVDTWRLNFGTAIELGPEGISEVGDYRAQWFPGIGQLALEGHPHAADSLCPAGLLAGAYDLAVDQLADCGHQPTGFLGVSRLDSTVTVRFRDARQGAVLLAGLAGLDWPGSEAIARPATRPRSVAVVHPRGRRHQLRAYDKATERGDVAAGLAEPFELVRLEAQWRYRSERRPRLTELDASAVRQRFERRFLPLYRASRGVKVATVPIITRDLADLLAAGELTHREAERLAGYLVLQEHGGDRRYPKYTRRDRRAELRRLGLAPAEDYVEPVEVDLADVLEAALETPLWGDG